MATIVKGRRAELRAAHDRARMVAYEQAQWVAYAFHDPKHMPRFAPLAEAGKVDEARQAVDDAKVRGWFIGMSMREH